jgi:hypothetical protein
MTKTLAEIATQMAEPFAIATIDLLPKGAIERDGKTLCMALPYADKRVYEDRLNVLSPGEWSTPPPVALTVGQKLVVYVTVIVCGVTHTDVGEAAAGGENAATESWAQGFKRACSQFGLGRYLYDLDKQWVPYDKQRKQIALDTAGVQSIVRQMYNKAHIPVGGSTPVPASSVAPSTPAQPQAATPRASAPTPVVTAQSMNVANDPINSGQLRGIEDLLINKLQRPFAREEYQGLTSMQASGLIQQLTSEWNVARQSKANNRAQVGAK